MDASGAGEARAEPLERLRTVLRRYYGDADLSVVVEAYRFAHESHADQRRLSGEPFITHPIAVAEILADHRLDPVTVAAALLHDVVEDCRVPSEEIRRRFGDEVAGLVEGVTKIGGIAARSRQDTEAENLRRLLVAVARDVRVLLIKLADRLHNMRTVSALAPEARDRTARETLEIYAPLADRMGMAAVRTELEDLAFWTLEPEAYAEIEHRLAETVHARAGLLEEARTVLTTRLTETGVRADVVGRTKEVYSIRQKMLRKGRAFDEIFDLLALRVLVETVRDCYAAVGAAHTLWRPMPRRFKDYVATPKPNMYQALHTSVAGPGGFPLEIQIRTREMDRIAEEGIAAHWRYKTGGEADERIAWLRRFLEVGSETTDPREFMEALKIDLYPDQVFIFTPGGDVKEMPAGSTVVDFAFAVHTEVGLQTIGAKADGRIVPLSHRPRSGEVVEILTQKGARPSRDWLKFVRTPRARNKIRHFFRDVEYPEMVERGREALRKEAAKARVEVPLDPPSEEIRRIAAEASFRTADDLLAAIAFGTVTAASIVRRLAGPAAPAAPPEPRPGTRPKAEAAAPAVRMSLGGATDIAVRMAGCCRPVPGDEIVGYVSRGRGLAVHRRDCPNLAALRSEPARIVETTWAAATASVRATVEVDAEDRVGLLAALTAALAAASANVASADCKTRGRGAARDVFVLEVRDRAHLDRVIAALREVPGVERVRRV